MNREASFYDPESSLVNDICRGDSSGLLDELFTSRTKRWPHPMMSVECGTIGTFSDLEGQITAPVAFDLAPQAIKLVLKQKNEDLVVTALSLLCELARASDTTETPPALAENWEQLRKLASTFSHNRDAKLYWENLCKWYRHA